ncbi:unnamed protein product, partial [Schistosoma mattheei]
MWLATRTYNYNCSPFTLEDDDNVEFEMDDDTYMAYLSCFDQDIISDSLVPSDSHNIPLESSNVNTKETFINELRSEVTEIYQQMNRMCVELCALTGTKQESCSKVGTHTPDELAMVEMDFRLGSLRSVLTDLRGLLKDLRIDIPEQPTSSNLSKDTVISDGKKAETIEPIRMSSSTNVQDIPLANYEMECQLVRSERDALAAELLNAQQELLDLKSQIENSSGNSSEVQNLQNTKGNNFVANWEVFTSSKSSPSIVIESSSVKSRMSTVSRVSPQTLRSSWSSRSSGERRKRMWSILAVTTAFAFSALAGMLSGPAALPLVICLMAMLISLIVGGPTSTERSVGAASKL